MKSLGRNVKESLLIQKFLKTNNSHIFYFWDELSDEEKDQLINELNNIELNKIKKYYEQYDENHQQNLDFKPADCFTIEERTKDLKEVGEEALRRGEVAFLTVAGGQASRLGYENPKGNFPISPIKNKSLFQIFAEKIKFYTEYYSNNFKWYIMTSETNYNDTKEFFVKNDFFKLDKNNVVFFKQGMFPTITLDGKLILSDKNKLFLNPDGHGGILKALLKNGLIKDMNAQGIKYLSYFQVDNPLINLADPYFIGYHISKKSKVTTKVIKKLYPEEKLGCIVNSLEKNSIIEYSDLPKEKMYEKDSAGELKYLFGSIGIHIFNVDFLLKATSKLPIHFAKKQIEGYIFKENDIAEKGQMNAIKFETFVFDVIAFANKSFFFETDREDEFAPLKNKTGVDSIETCIKGQISQYKNWLKKSGLLITDLTDQKLEISPLFTPDEIIFLEKAKKQPEYIKQKIYDENGNLRENIFID